MLIDIVIKHMLTLISTLNNFKLIRDSLRVTDTYIKADCINYLHCKYDFVL